MTPQEQLSEYLRGISAPRGFRWLLEPRDNMLFLTVQSQTPTGFEFYGHRWFSGSGGWVSVRELSAPNYASMVAQLIHWPEFLEFKQEGHSSSVK